MTNAEIPMTDAPQLKPPPRGVKFRSVGAIWDVWKWRALGLALGGVPLFLWWTMLEAPIVSGLGKDVTARLEEIRPWLYKGREGPDGRRFDVVYSFEIGGGRREVGYGIIDTQGAAPPKRGDGLQVRVLYLWPRYHSVLKERESRWLQVCCFSIFATAASTFWIVGTWVVLYPALRERRIMRRGIGAVGSVSRKVQKDDPWGKEYLIWYRFPAADGQTWGDKGKVSLQDFAQYSEGQPVFVVYLKDRPKASVLYEASYYRAR